MEQTHQFRDEWLVPLLRRLPTELQDKVAKWRAERRPFVAQMLVDTGIAKFEEIAEWVRSAFRIGVVPLSVAPPDKTTLALLPEKVVRKYQVLPVRAEPRRLDLAMLNPLDEEAIQAARWAANREIVPLYCTPSRLDQLLRNTLSPEAVIFDLLQRIESPMPVEVLGVPNDEMLHAEQVEVRAPVIQLVNAVIADAVTRRASDIHIEHDDHATTVRYRIDGQLRTVIVLPRYLGVGPVVSRIKIMARLDVSDRLRPQDGRAKLRVGGNEIGLRVSTLPTRAGEKVVIRILDERSVQTSLASLGLAPTVLRRLQDLIGRKQGLFLVTGPTGSGKTTTLYAALNERRSDAVNVVTVEDPIEYKLPGINQVQVSEKQGLTFASVLRSVLRQDPDVVLLGEIRDTQTASVAIQAAMTGHLVLSTLHTNDAVGAVTRLRDMGIEPFKLSASLLGVSSQRLARRNCPSCAAPASAESLDANMRRAMEAARLEPRHARGAGCENCGFTGYNGRVALTELFTMTPELTSSLAAGMGADELRREAARAGALHTMESDCLIHISAGATSVEEAMQYMDMRQVAGTASASTPAGPGGERQSVLIAVADNARRAALAAAFAFTGSRVSEATDGPAALGVAAKERPDLIVVDLELPVLDGVQVLRMATTVLALDCTSVLLVPAGRENAMDQLRDSGATDLVQLPADADAVHERARSALLRKRGWSDTADVMRPPIPMDDEARVAAVRATKLMDTQPEERFDQLTRTAQRVFNVPFALVTLIDRDRQWYKSNQGLSGSETAREASFCAHAINSAEVMVVPDATLDPRFAENSSVTGDPNIRFYAGYPLTGPGGHKLGTLCIIDNKPRVLSSEDEAALRDLGGLVEAEIRRSG